MTKPKDRRKDLAKEIASKTTQQFGHKSGHTGSDLANVKLDVYPTGIPSLDYTLGIGGYPRGFLTEVYGAPEIGKSTIFGLGGVREAQKQGALCGWVAMEPGFDVKWAARHGVDLDALIVGHPEDGNEAFAMFYEWVDSGAVDFIVFDSIGAVPAAAKNPGDVKAFGASGIISAGITNLAPLLYKHNVAAVALNQQRDDTNAKIPGLVKPPGGHAIKHASPVRVHVKAGRDRYYTKVGKGKEAHDVLRGRRLIAQVAKNQMTEKSAQGAKTQFDFYHMEVEGEPFGLDLAENYATIGKLSGIIEKKGSWLNHPAFPGGKVQGVDKLRDLIKKQPTVGDTLYTDLINAMLAAQDGPVAKPTLEAVAD